MLVVVASVVVTDSVVDAIVDTVVVVVVVDSVVVMVVAVVDSVVAVVDGTVPAAEYFRHLEFDKGFTASMPSGRTHTSQWVPENSMPWHPASSLQLCLHSSMLPVFSTTLK